jgi:hypothetical protein
MLEARRVNCALKEECIKCQGRESRHELRRVKRTEQAVWEYTSAELRRTYHHHAYKGGDWRK